jgi:hypothetical protein
VDEMVEEIITLTQIFVEKLVMASKGDDDEHDEKDFASSRYESNLSS